MKRFILILWMLLVVPLTANAFKVSVGGIVPRGTELPSTCEEGTLFIDTDADTDGVLYFCKTTNNWKASGGGGSGTVGTSGSPASNDIARFTDSDTIEGRSYSEFRSDLNLVDKTAAEIISETWTLNGKRLTVLTAVPADSDLVIRDKYWFDSDTVDPPGLGLSIPVESMLARDTTELMPNQVDRDFSGASAWADVDLSAYHETDDLTITANTANQYCTLVAASAPTTTNGAIYVVQFDVANIVGTWTLKDFDGTNTLGTISANGTDQEIIFTSDDANGGFQLVAVGSTSSGDFDNFSLNALPWIAQQDQSGSDYHGDLQLPYSTSGDNAVTEGYIYQKSDEDAITLHGGSSGKVKDEALISLIQHISVAFDPAGLYAQEDNYNVLPLTKLEDDFPHGIKLVELRAMFVSATRTTNLNMDLICDTTPDFNSTAAGTIMDSLDILSSAQTFSEDTTFASSTCANGSYLYLELDTDPTDANELLLVDIWFYAEED